MKTETILIDDAYFTLLLTDIKSAKQSIDIEMYIFNDDAAGKILSDALCEAANRGVKIRVMVDGVGTLDWGNETTKKMEKCGILTKVYHPVPWILSHWHYEAHAPNSVISKFVHLLKKVNSRNHRKCCVIDNRIVYVGSANITEHLLHDQDKNEIWRETSVRITGVKTDLLLYSFEKAWRGLGFKKMPKPDLASINRDAIFRLNYTRKARRVYYANLLENISYAKKRVWVTNSYFVPESRLLKKLIAASRRGIDVRILLPNLSDVFIESLASKTFYSILLKNKVTIYEYLPSILHAKSLMIDDWYLVGSSNLNYRSLRHDLEIDVNIQSVEAKLQLENQFEVDVKNSRKMNIEDVKAQPVYLYLLGRVILFFRHWI